jgi:hypothetical protein
VAVGADDHLPVCCHQILRDFMGQVFSVGMLGFTDIVNAEQHNQSFVAGCRIVRWRKVEDSAWVSENSRETMMKEKCLNLFV